MKISLIIPAYNSSLFIRKCLDSCIHQNKNEYVDYEIIIINDGSTDDTVSVAKSALGQFENYSIYSKANGGLSSARNLGLRKATGDYIWFVDSDDWIDAGSLVTISNMVNHYRPEVLMINASDVLEDTTSQPRLVFNSEDEILTGIDVFLSHNWNACAPFYIYSKAFLDKHHLSFFEGIFHEDNEFTPRMLFFAKSVVQTNKVMYFVRQTPGSITRSFNPKRAFDILTVAQSLNKFSLDNIFEKNVSIRMSWYISMCLNSAFLQAALFDKTRTKNFEKALISNKSVLENFLKSKSIKYMIEYMIFKLSGSPIHIFKLIGRIKK